MGRRRKKQEERAIAQARMLGLLEAARREAGGPDGELADRHADLARRIGLKYQLGLGGAWKAHVCKACGAYRVPATSRTRVHHGRIVTTCLRCGHRRRRPLGPRPATPRRMP